MSHEFTNTLSQQAYVAIQSAKTPHELLELRAKYLGKKGVLTEQLKNLVQLSHEDRKTVGQRFNQLKDQIYDWLAEREQALRNTAVATELSRESIDVTLPGRAQSAGSLHPVTLCRERIENFFVQAGFRIMEGPEVEDEEHNFTALNIPAHHPARAMHDTFYFAENLLLRTHTSNVQIRAMKTLKPPLRLITPGRVYRRDSDVTHTPMFHQMEMLLIDEQANFAQLKGLLQDFIRDFFGRSLKTRFRPSYFPFTEPSAEVDIECVSCGAKGCRICKQTGWLEVLGCGMVHPEVLKNVGIDAEKYRGFAFGMGIDRMAMLYYGIDDLRTMFENDIRFLEQFE